LTNLKHISAPDYMLINEAPLFAQRALVNIVRLLEEKKKSESRKAGK